MKRLLGLVAVVALVAAMVPGTGIAGLRGAFDPIGRGDLGALVDGVPFGTFLSNGEQTAAPRAVPVGAGNGVALLERWITFTTRVAVVGQEGSREIWQLFNRTSSPLTVNLITDARQKILGDPTGIVSYIDPSWSPNGKWLAYCVTDNFVTSTSLVIQQFNATTNMATSIAPVGAPIVVLPNVGVRYRHPEWSPDGNSLAFDSDASGTSIDIYTIAVFPTIGSPVQQTFVNNRAEQNPSWAPDGVRIAYDTNKFGPNVIEIVDTSNGSVSLAEQNFAAVSHSHPGWASNGHEIYYDAPGAEDSQQNQNIWKLDMTSQSKCEIALDGAGDVNVRVSKHTNQTNNGIPYNNIYFESQAFGGSLGQPNLIIWRANPIQRCVAPLPMAIEFKPNSFNFGSGQPDSTGSGDTAKNGTDLGVIMSFPPETQAAGYQCIDLNGAREGVRLRTGGILPSPTVMGLNTKVNPATGLPYMQVSNGSETITTYVQRRRIESRLVALGLINKTVSIQVDAYSNIVGQRFRGFGLLKVSTSSLAGSAVKLEQNSPNPFNPMTKIRFAVSKDSHVALRVYNVRGQLVKTLVNERMGQGMHEVSWDGKDRTGSHVASGVYYAKVASDGGNQDVIKMVVAK